MAGGMMKQKACPATPTSRGLGKLVVGRRGKAVLTARRGGKGQLAKGPQLG